MKSTRSLLALLIILLAFCLVSPGANAAQKGQKGQKTKITQRAAKKQKKQEKRQSKKSKKAQPAADYSLAKNGVTTCEPVGVMDLPPAARTTIEHQAGFGSTVQIVKIVKNGQLTYQTQVTRNGRTQQFMVSGSGKIIKPAEDNQGKKKSGSKKNKKDRKN
jgi:hypothetical protein